MRENCTLCKVSSNSKNFNFNPFEPDGTINYDAQQIVFDIQYNTPVDYDAEGTGLANPNVDTAPQAIYTYITKTVKSRFSKGKFEQDIDGVLFQDPFSVKASSGAGGGTIDGDANGNDSDWTDDGTDGDRGTDPATIGGGRGGIGGPTAEELAINNAAVARQNFGATDPRLINSNPLPATTATIAEGAPPGWPPNVAYPAVGPAVSSTEPYRVYITGTSASLTDAEKRLARENQLMKKDE